MHGALRTGRASSVDFRFQGIDHLQQSAATSPRSPTQVSMFEKLARRNKSITRDDFVGEAGFSKDGAAGFSSVASPKYEKGAFVWRDRDEVKTGRWRTRKTLLYGGLLLTLVIVAWTQDILNTPASQIYRRRSQSSSKASLLSSRATCNPYARQGNFEIDWAEPSNNVWRPASSSGSGKKRSLASGDCAAAPQYMAHLRNSDFAGLEWMRNRTVLLIGDSIERDHVSLFCSLLGREPETVKGHHKFAPGGGAASKDILESPRQAEIKKKDRGARIAFKGMQESTLPRTCYIEELNFMIANLYHFGLDEQEYWATLDQYHGPGPIEARFEQQVAPFLHKLSQAGRSVDLVEIGSGHYDLARWAREDIENKASPEEPLSAERLSWYKQRVSTFVALAEKYFPTSTRTYRPPTPPEEQAAELDYFNDRFGHSPSTVTAYFAPLRVHQLDAEIRSLLQPLEPSARSAPVDSGRALRKVKRDAVPAGSDSTSSAEGLIPGTYYNTWAQLVKGAPAHQLDRLHGGDLAAPGAVLWSDMMLWHLRHGTQDDL